MHLTLSLPGFEALVWEPLMLWQRNSLKAKYGGVTVGADGPGRAGAFSGGPSPLLGTRLLPSTAGREGPASSQRREPGQLSPQPRHGGRYVSEDFCPWEKGDFPRTEEDGVSAQSPDGDMGGAGTMQRGGFGPGHCLLRLLGPITKLSRPQFPRLEASLQCVSTCVLSTGPCGGSVATGDA